MRLGKSSPWYCAWHFFKTIYRSLAFCRSSAYVEPGVLYRKTLDSLSCTRLEQVRETLILHCDSPILNNLYFVETNHIGHHDHYANKARRIDAPIRYITPELHIVGSCNGLLCVSSALYFNPLLVFNPWTTNYIRLPNTTQYLKQEVVFGFGFHPTTMESRIYGYHKQKSTPTNPCLFPRPSFNSWVKCLENFSMCSLEAQARTSRCITQWCSSLGDYLT